MDVRSIVLFWRSIDPDWSCPLLIWVRHSLLIKVMSRETSYRLAVDAHTKRKKRKNIVGMFSQARKSKKYGTGVWLKGGGASKPWIDRFYQVKRNRKYFKKRSTRNFLIYITEWKNPPGHRPVSSSLLPELTELPGWHQFYALNLVPFPIRFISSISWPRFLYVLSINRPRKRCTSKATHFPKKAGKGRRGSSRRGREVITRSSMIAKRRVRDQR